ncbi:hypothetical protein BJY01DRAFT_256314 [Aspergillus pseudoustus]|uniref:Methyltransferase type 11 domain-containing protein n=1 Tax=Aspergillus pseudoustus TaxID=1810923 RepID=A0ABR4IBW3_9EURO
MAHQPPHSDTDPKKGALESQGQNWDWTTYAKYRPAYPDSLFEALYAYHAAGAGAANTFGIAHDVGAGPGIVSARLAQRFDHVNVSDPHSEFLKIARTRLSAPQPAPASEPYPPEGGGGNTEDATYIDLVIVAEALHWTDIPDAVAEFARRLKSGGTPCIVQYGPVWIMDDDDNNIMHAQQIWESMFRDVIVRDIFFNGCGDPTGKEIYVRAARQCATGFDNVAFPPSAWRDDVVRVFTNTGDDRTRVGLVAPDAGVGQEEDALGSGGADRRVFVEDDPERIVDGVDLAWLQGIFASFVPGRRAEEDLDRWKEMERALELAGGTVRVAWPSVRIFASRR